MRGYCPGNGQAAEIHVLLPRPWLLGATTALKSTNNGHALTITLTNQTPHLRQLNIPIIYSLALATLDSVTR